MRHNPQTGVFCGSYINEKVRFIVQDAVLDQPTNIGFLHASTHMSLTCDPRAPIDVPEEFLKALPPDPEIMELVEPVVHHQFPERTQLQEVLCDLSRDMSPSDIVSRRIRTIDLMVALSRRQEQEVQHSNHSSRESSEFSEEQPLCEDPFSLLCKKTQCIICIGDDRSICKYRTRTYATSHKMMNHVGSHLKEVPKFQRISCTHPVCQSEGLILKHLQHFKNHVQTVHDISLRP